MSYDVTNKHTSLGLRFVEFETEIMVDEDVGSVELCISYRGENVPPTTDATITPSYGWLPCNAHGLCLPT